ncbi:hypothetical protein M1N19_01420 [Dehalococcoidia bacterium]|nr:hypothetical protein [Dehalococcoidia bacterium]
MVDVKLLEVLTKDGEGKVYIQVPSEVSMAGEEEIAIAAAGRRLLERFDELGQYIADRADELLERIKAAGDKARPDKITLNFGVGVEGERGIPFVAKGSAEANIWVQLEWTTQLT